MPYELLFAKTIFEYLLQDMTFHSEEFSKKHQADDSESLPNHILKMLEEEINSLMKVFIILLYFC